VLNSLKDALKLLELVEELKDSAYSEGSDHRDEFLLLVKSRRNEDHRSNYNNKIENVPTILEVQFATSSQFEASFQDKE
jgi:hypothetical protein